MLVLGLSGAFPRKMLSWRPIWSPDSSMTPRYANSARLQVIDPDANGRYYRLVRTFGELTGTLVLLNTSFNNNAEPIVQDVRDALTCFLTTELDALAFDNLIPEFRPVTRLVKRVRTTLGRL